MLDEAPYDMTAVAFQRDTTEDDKRLFVLFNEEAVKDNESSIREGRPIYKMVPFVMIMVPGDKDSVVHRRAEDRDKDRFSRQWDAFQKKQDQTASGGTPLKVLPWLTKAQIKELEFFNVTTVEHLANFPDSSARNFMGAQTMKGLAKAFLEAAKGQAPYTAMQAELEKRDEELKFTRESMAILQAQVDELKKQMNSGKQVAK